MYIDFWERNLPNDYRLVFICTGYMYYNQIVRFVMGYDFINLCICNTLPKALVTYGKPQKCWIKTFL